jgi:hypothetical protein
MKAFKNKMKGVWDLVKSDRFILITTTAVSKNWEDGEDVGMRYNNMTQHDIMFYSDTVAEIAEQEIRAEEEADMSINVGKRMAEMIFKPTSN